MFFRKKQSEPSLNDLEVLEKYFKTGDLQLLAELFSAYMPLVYGVCLKYLKNREDSQDAVMQIYEKLSSEPRLREVKNFKSWLFVVTKNHCLMQLRGKKTFISHDFSEAIMENGVDLHPNEQVAEHEHADQLHDCIEQLNSPQQKCIKLFYLEEKCYKDIAEQLEADLNWVKSNIQNGKRNLKKCLQEKHEKKGFA